MEKVFACHIREKRLSSLTSEELHTSITRRLNSAKEINASLIKKEIKMGFKHVKSWSDSFLVKGMQIKVQDSILSTKF